MDAAHREGARRHAKLLQERLRDFHIASSTDVLVRSSLGAFVHTAVDNVSTIPTTTYGRLFGIVSDGCNVYACSHAADAGRVRECGIGRSVVAEGSAGCLRQCRHRMNI